MNKIDIAHAAALVLFAAANGSTRALAIEPPPASRHSAAPGFDLPASAFADSSAKAGERVPATAVSTGPPALPPRSSVSLAPASELASTRESRPAHEARPTHEARSSHEARQAHEARTTPTQSAHAARTSQPAQAPGAVVAADAAQPTDPLAATGAPPWSEADTVQALLRAETERAIMAARRQAAMMAQASAGAVPPLAMPTSALPPGRFGSYDQESRARGSAQTDDHLQLAAIYGVGRRLHVEILVNGRRTLYRAGHRLPLERDLAGEPYTLAAIAGACVRLQAAGRARSACLGQLSGGH